MSRERDFVRTRCACAIVDLILERTGGRYPDEDYTEQAIDEIADIIKKFESLTMKDMK